MQKTFLLSVLLWISPVLGQTTEQKVLEGVQEMMRTQQEVIFSELYNDDRFSSEEKDFLGRLYEIFFSDSSFSQIGTRDHRLDPDSPANLDGLRHQSADLLLAVMQTDPRMPSLFHLNTETGEIESLELENIDAFVARRGTTVKVTQWVGEPVPPFKLSSFQNETYRSQDLKGKNLLIYFWFTGCPPCIRIAPILQQLDRKYSDSNFQVIGFNADRILELEVTDQQRQDYLQDQGLRFVNLHVDRPTRQAFGNINVFPTLFFVDSDGTIFRYVINYLDREALESIVREFIQAG